MTGRDDRGGLLWAQVAWLFVAALITLGVLLAAAALGTDTRTSVIAVAVAAAVVVVATAFVTLRFVRDAERRREQRDWERLAAVVEHSSDVVVLTDGRGRVTYASPGLRAVIGYDPSHWSGRHLGDVVVDAEREVVEQHLAWVIDQGAGSTTEFETTLAHLDGYERTMVLVIANLIGPSAVDAIVATFRDVTEQRNLERQLSHRAFHDELTGLANRALFLDRLDHALRIARHEVDPVVVLFVDLDDFKEVNDGLGHVVGDQVLRNVADRIRRTADDGDTIARLGGDEFALLLEDRGGVDRALGLAEELLESLDEPVGFGAGEVSVLASVGVAVAGPGMSTTNLLRDADIAMYEAKRSGKGQVRIFDPTMRLGGSRQFEYRAELAAAIEQGQLRLVYMPFVDLGTGQVVGAEALVRWRHPTYGDLAAAEFVPVAERSGLIVPLGDWAIGEAFAAASRWRRGLLLGMNLSLLQLRQADIVDRVLELVDAHALDPTTVMFDVAEATLSEGGDEVDVAVARFRDAGVRFAIDDYGADQASLASLQRHPVDVLKIDHRAVRAFAEKPHAPALARTIVQAAASLDLVTVGEGIETATQLRELRRLGCDLGQGHLLSYPIESDETQDRFGDDR